MNNQFPNQLYSAFELSLINPDNLGEHSIRNNFFEIIYIVEGTGQHIRNSNRYTYFPGQSFLLTNVDEYKFDVQTKSTFCSIRFTNEFFNTTVNGERLTDYPYWFSTLNYILYNHNRVPGCVLKNEVDRVHISTLIELLMMEYTAKNLNYWRVLQHIMMIILDILARNICNQGVISKNDNVAEEIYTITTYIQEHIYDGTKLSIQNLASVFHKSETYISNYFKIQTGHSISEYITKYKLSLVESKLLLSDLRISEIADQLNYTDGSHLTNIFKKYKGISPSKFRSQMNAKRFDAS